MTGQTRLLRQFKLFALAQSKLILHFFDHLSIGRKLNVGFGVLVGLTFLVVGRNYWGVLFATDYINRTQKIRVPTALASNQAQKELLQMSAHIRGYLITGKSEFRNSYYLSKRAFDQELALMVALLETKSQSENNAKLNQLKTLYQQWNSLPDELFSLSDQYLENQPALKLFRNEGELALLTIQSEIQSVVDLQAQRSPSVNNIQMLKALAAFQNSFSLLGASLRAYLLTRHADFRFEYTGYLLDNDQQWQTLLATSDNLTPAQQKSLETVKISREKFLALAPSLLEIVEGDRYREDLYIFSTQAEPLATEMLVLLNDIVASQQQRLVDELATGRKSLITAQWQTLLGSFLALAIALAMTVLLRKKIADPIVRLTQATTRVIDGNFEVKAAIESTDEIGTLAKTFNRMTGYLQEFQQTLEGANSDLQKQKSQLESKNIQIGQALEALKLTQAQLIQTEKMSGLGQMVAGIAHEINNPVNFIHGNLACMEEYTVDLIHLLQQYQLFYPQPPAEIEQTFEKLISILCWRICHAHLAPWKWAHRAFETLFCHCATLLD
ncbi:MAG: HAMP domain-containing protein [Phormidesmis sp. RL_2_1]|nr:HAMP domain-containing protein [Phormidesmis sp. RL_2_1]